MKAQLRIFIVDNHPLFRRGLRTMIEAEAGWTVIGEAANQTAAWPQLNALRPHIIVFDLEHPSWSGFSLARAIHQHQLPVALILLTRHDDEEIINIALDLEVRGYVLKDCAEDEIIHAIRAVSSGQIYFSAVVAGRFLNRLYGTASDTGQAVRLAGLTATERRILGLVADYKSSKEIGIILSLSSRTVDNYRNNMCQKLGLEGKFALLKFALAHKAEASAVLD